MKTAIVSAVALIATLIPLHANPDLSGQWTDGKSVTLELHPPKPVTGLGVGVLKVKDHKTQITFIGTWKVISSGRWKGYISVDGLVGTFLRGGKVVIPDANPTVILFGKEGDEIQYIKGGDFPDQSGNLYRLGGENCVPFRMKKVKDGKDLAPISLPNPEGE